MVEGVCITGQTATAADGMHPTGMDSCSSFSCSFSGKIWPNWLVPPSPPPGVSTPLVWEIRRLDHWHLRTYLA